MENIKSFHFYNSFFSVRYICNFTTGRTLTFVGWITMRARARDLSFSAAFLYDTRMRLLFILLTIAVVVLTIITVVFAILAILSGRRQRPFPRSWFDCRLAAACFSAGGR
jgi:hypothetical protein